MIENIIKLPKFVLDAEIAKALKETNLQVPENVSIRFIFDWSEVVFFDDYALLKLIFIQRNLRLQGCRVVNKGFRSIIPRPNRQALLRQLWAVGWPELTASGHLIGDDKLKLVLEDDVQLLESNPISVSSISKAVPAVIPMLCCHNSKHYIKGSREEKQLDSFVRGCLNPSGAEPVTWDLVENRTFRHLIVDQLRRNVHEHAGAKVGNAIGLAIVRIWRMSSLEVEWELTSKDKQDLLTHYKKQPVGAIYNQLTLQNAILQIAVVDDGDGIPRGLAGVHQKYVVETEQGELFATERILYKDQGLNQRFQAPAFWPDAKARLIAFATDVLGTSKADRAPEVKGLHYLREQAVILRKGAAFIESDGACIASFDKNKPYGEPANMNQAWCNIGGTGVSIAVPMYQVKASIDSCQWTPFYAFSNHVGGDLKTVHFRIKDHLSDKYEENEMLQCVGKIVLQIKLDEIDEDISTLRKKGLLLVDWGGLPESKRIFHQLFFHLEKALSVVDAWQQCPFVFVNLPKGLCALLETSLNIFSKFGKALPICCFTAESREPFWLGLDTQNSALDKLILRSVDGQAVRKRTLADKLEKGTEALFRDCLTNLLLSHARNAMFLNDPLVLKCVAKENKELVVKNQAFTYLESLARRTSLLRLEKERSRNKETAYTGRYQPVFALGEIEAHIRTLFLNKFREVFTAPPVCFTPKNERHGVRLLHGTRVVRRYFRSDALVDSNIAMELVQELTSAALGIAKSMPSGRIDCIVSCTSPLHWFVHKIVDGLEEQGIISAHHVFASYEDITTDIEEIRIGSGETLLVFTDIISSGQTSLKIADSLSQRYNVKIAGLLALADIRSKKDREEAMVSSRMESVFGGNIICLYNEPEQDDHDSKLIPAYYVHPETVVPKPTGADAMEDFFLTNYSGTGPLVENHAFFSHTKNSLELLASLDAVRFGHFQHGSHHSELFVDVEKLLANEGYRNIAVTALFRYIIKQDIRLVLYPNHSSAYLLIDDLKQRFQDLAVQFIMACRTYKGKGTKGTSYALTRFTPHPDPMQWDVFSNHGVLVLDDAVCSGTTVESIIAELVRIDRDYYKSASPSDSPRPSQFPLHVVAVLNRLPRVSYEFWKGLPRISQSNIQFSTLVTMPLASDSDELCPHCRLKKELEHIMGFRKGCLYAKEFLHWWISTIEVVSSHERKHSRTLRAERFSSEEALRLAGYLSAIERKGYDQVRTLLYCDGDKEVEEISKRVRVHVRGRAAFVHDMYPNSETVEGLIHELRDLLDLSITSATETKDQETSLLEVLQLLTQRYLRRRPSTKEVELVIVTLFTSLGHLFDNRLIVGGVAAVLDSCLTWFTPPHLSEMELLVVRKSLGLQIHEAAKLTSLSERSALTLDWFCTYLADKGEELNSVGAAVKLLADFAKQGRRNHFYGRHEVDELAETFRLPPMEVPADATETIRRTISCTDVFSKLIKATRVLQSVTSMEEHLLHSLQEETDNDVQELRSLCASINVDTPENVIINYTKLKTTFLRTYNRWFPHGNLERPRAVEIISSFTPNLCNVVAAAWGNFSPHRLCKERMSLDMSDLSRHSYVRVLMDPTVLTTTLNQLWDNIDRLAIPTDDNRVEIVFTLVWSDKSEDIDVMVKAGEIGLKVSNTCTPRPNLDHLKQRGLSAARIRLSEYGGSLANLVPTLDFTFEVMLKFLVWTEEEI